MHSAAFTYAGQAYTLTTDHPSSTNDKPVLLDAAGKAYGPWDVVIDNPSAPLITGGRYHARILARGIAQHAIRQHPRNSTVRDLVSRYAAIPEMADRR